MSDEERNEDYNEGEEEEEEGEEYNDDDNGEYEYTYEDELDDVIQPKLCREISESHFDVPVGSYMLYNYTDIAPLMEKLISEVSVLLGVTRDTSELLLRHMKWNQGLLAESYYNNPKKALILAGIELETDTEKKVSSDSVCLICFEPLQPGAGHSLNCHHEFCR